MERRRPGVDDGAGRTGRRVAEVGQPTVGTPKSRAGVRTIALPPNLRQPLRRHLVEHAMPGPDGLLFPNAARTGHLHVNTLFKTYHRLSSRWPAGPAGP